MTTYTLPLSSAAYAAETFDETFDSFRTGMPEGFTFSVRPVSYVNNYGQVVGTGGLEVLTNDEDHAAEIIGALESAVAPPD